MDLPGCTKWRIIQRNSIHRNNVSLFFQGLRWNEPLVKSLFNKIIEQLNPETAPNVLMLALQLEEAQKYDGMNVVSDLFS